jgi:hypothetical protein
MNPTGNPTVSPTAIPRSTPTKAAGWIYMLHTAYDTQKYVGQSKRPVWKRVAEERKTFPWGCDILPGRDGYTILRRVPSLGNPLLDEIALDLAEAEEIQKWHPSENAHRPDPQVFRDRLALARVNPTLLVAQGRGAVPRKGPPAVPRGRAKTPPHRRPFPWRGVLFVAVGVLCALAVGRMSPYFPNPTVAWVVIPMAAVLGPAWVFRIVHNAIHPRPRRRSRRRRRHH